MRLRALVPFIAIGVIISGALVYEHPFAVEAQSSPSLLAPSTAQCCGGGDSAPGVAPRELDFPYYNLADGFESTLLLVSDSPKTMHFTLAVRSSHGGLMLSTAESIEPQQKLSIDLRSVVTQLGGDPNGAYAQGSVALYFIGTIMPIVGQISIRNPQLSLSHESEMVENDPGRSDIPPVLNGVWWGLGGGVEAEVIVSNTSDSPQIARVYLDFGGKRHPLSKPLAFLPYETKTLDVTRLVESLGVDPAGAPAGGITIVQIGPNPALIANGKITDPATGFSSTIDFPLPQNERASALHATGLPIGTPSKDSPFAGTGTYTPRVVVRNLLATPQSVTITVESPESPAATTANPSTPNTPAPSVGAPLAAPSATPRMVVRPRPLPGDKHLHPEWGAGLSAATRSLNVMTLPVAGYSTIDYSLASAMLQLPLPLPFCSIRIHYSGPPGSMEAEVSSVENMTQMVVDARVENEGNGWAGSGANPWHLDKNTESILFLTNEGAKTARIGFSITASGVHYYLTELRLQPHETRAINIRALRDAQVADFKKNKIPAGATDGSVSWIRIDDAPVMGRLMVITRKGKMDSSYDCCTCPCPASLSSLALGPALTFYMVPGQDWWGVATANYAACNGTINPVDVTDTSQWFTDNSAVAEVIAAGEVEAVSGGVAHIRVTYSGFRNTSQGPPPPHCVQTAMQLSDTATCTVQVPTSLSVVSGTSSTTSESECSTSSGTGCGVTRTFMYQVLDQYGNPIQMSGIEVWDSISVNQQRNGLDMGQPNTTCTGKSGGTNGGPCSVTTNASGQFGEKLSVCSTVCWNGSSCVTGASTTATQTPHANQYTLNAVTLTYECNQVLVNGG